MNAASNARAPSWLPNALLAALLALVVARAVTTSFTSPQSVDNRTYLEMIDGVAHHGLPYTTNGPVGRHHELQARWNNYARGRLWGAFPPVFPYLAAPAYRLGGTVAVVRGNVLLLGLLALIVARLTRRLTGDPLSGACAAWATLLATPVSALASDTSPYTVMITAVAGAVDFAVASLGPLGARISPRMSRRYAAAAGLLAGVAVGSQPLGFPTMAPLLASLFVIRSEADEALTSGALPSWLPTSASITRGLYGVAGALTVLGPVGALNRVRFGSWNPVTYGPCVWRSCVETGLDQQGIGPMLKWAAPVLLWAAMSLSAMAFVRRSRAGLAVVAALSLGALAPPSQLHDKAVSLVALAWGFIVDISPLRLDYGFVQNADGLGVFLGPFAVKALLQCTPAALLATLAGVAARGASTRRAVVLAAIPCAALLASLAMRANLPFAFALGYPFLYLRYVVPAMPVVMALTMLSVRALPWRAWHAALGVALAAGLSLWLLRWDDDFARSRRVVILRLTLVVAAAAFTMLARTLARRRAGARAAGPWPHAAAVGVTVAFALSVAVTVAVDLREVQRNRRENEAHVESVARLLPRRLALVGYPVQMDPVLGLRATRDIEYFDLYETRGWLNVAPVVRHWWREGRPIFALLPPGAPLVSPMPEARFAPIDPALGVFAILPAAPLEPEPPAIADGIPE